LIEHLAMEGGPMPKGAATLFFVMVLAGAPAIGQAQYPFQNPNTPIEARIDNILSLMTLDEKLAAMGMGGIRVPRLGIRGTGIGEALSGVVLGGPMMSLMAPPAGGTPSAVGGGQQAPSIGIEGLDPKELLEMFQAKPVPTTQFPQGVGLARTWNPGLVRRAGAVIGSEARYIYENEKTRSAALVLLTPNADLARDPRLGHSQIKRFLILHKELDADDGELTRTRKVRRKFISERYGVLVEALYSSQESCMIDAQLKFEDGRVGNIRATLKLCDVQTYPLATA